MMFLSWSVTPPLAEAGQEKQMNENTTKHNYNKLKNSVQLQYADFTKVFFTFKMTCIIMLV